MKSEKRVIGMSDIKTARSIRGFTIIELMIAVSIVAILTAMAVPAYRDYSIRSKITECINGAAVGKVGISEYRQSLGPWPPSITEAGLDLTGISHYCSALNNYQSTTGAFTVDINEAMIDLTLAPDSILPVLTPTQGANNIINWNCSRGATTVASVKYLPASCRGA